MEFAKLNLKVLSPQPNWAALGQYFAMFVTPLASQKLLFPVLETVLGLFVLFVRCSVFRFNEPNYQNPLVS